MGAESRQPHKEEDDITACSEDVELNEVPVMPTAQEIENWEKESREAGFKKGYEEGLARASDGLPNHRNNFTGLSSQFTTH